MDIQKIKDFIKKLQANGIPVVMFQDIKTKEPSFSFTLALIATLIYIVAIFSNYFAFLKGINVDASLNFVLCAYSLYFGRKLSFNGESVSR